MFYPGHIRSRPPEALMVLYWLLIVMLVVGGGIAFYCAHRAGGQVPPHPAVDAGISLGLTLWGVAVGLDLIRRVVRRLVG